MSADALRRAAALMRERAEAATPSRWRFTDSEAVNDVWEAGLVVVSNDGDPIANVQDEWYEPDPAEPAPLHDAQHIASWHPTVALAVADLLDNEASLIEGALAYPDLHMPLNGARINQLTAVAHAYLGETP